METTDRIPLLKVGDLVLVTIQVELHDRLALALQEDLAEHIARHGTRGVLLDIRALQTIDSFVGRILGNIASIAALLGAEAVVVGMRPQVAITLVELGVTLKGIRTALDVERGMALLRASLRGGSGGAGDDHRTT